MIYGIIPARIGSTRLPGKMLLEVEGKPVLWHTWNRSRQSRLVDRLVIAAGDAEISNAAKSWGADVVEVFEECQSGSDRVWRAYRKMELAGSGCGLRIDSERAVHRREAVDDGGEDIVINIQGDEIEIDGVTIDGTLNKLLADPGAGVGTAAAPVSTFADYQGSAVVKVVLDKTGRALYFSRAPIPSELTEESYRKFQPLRHIGLYAYRRSALERFSALPPGELELTERLEQLRLLYDGIPYTVEVVARAGIEINTPEDLEQVRARGLK